jgi:uncharacterized protein YjbI with pentapeptide repeats
VYVSSSNPLGINEETTAVSGSGTVLVYYFDSVAITKTDDTVVNIKTDATTSLASGNYTSTVTKTDIKSVEIKGTLITSIGTDAFKDCTNMESMTISDSVDTISNSAFDSSGITTLYVTSNNGLGPLSAGTHTVGGESLTVYYTNVPPEFVSSNTSNTDEDIGYTYTIVVSYVNGVDNVTVEATTKPSWLSFNGTTKVLSGNPTNSEVGSHTIDLTASDATVGQTATQSLTVTVINVNDPPTGTNGSLTTNEDTTGTLDVSTLFVDPDVGDALTYSVTTDPTKGTASISGNTLTYIPNDHYYGSDSLIVTAADVKGETGTSTISITVNEVNDTITGLVTITGTPTEYQVLTADVSGIIDIDGIVSYSYQWYRDGEILGGEINQTYSLIQADVLKKMSVKVFCTDTFGRVDSLTSSETSEVENVNDPPVGTVVIIGIATEDQILTADISGITDIDGIDTSTWSYQWLRNDIPITGEINRTYILKQVDVDNKIKVVATYVDNFSNIHSVTSSATSEVENVNDLPTGLVTIEGERKIDKTLTTITSALQDEDGLENVIFTYQWMRENILISGATNKLYTTTENDVGKILRVIIYYTDDQGTFESVTSVPTEMITKTIYVTSGNVLTIVKDEKKAINAGNTIIIETGGKLENYGIMNLESIAFIENNGTIINHDTAKINIKGSILNKQGGILINDGSINNKSNNTITNEGTIKQNGILTNNGTITGTGAFEFGSLTAYNNTNEVNKFSGDSPNFTVLNNMDLDSYKEFTTTLNITNNESLTITDNATVTNNISLIQNGKIKQNGAFNDQGTLEGTGTFEFCSLTAYNNTSNVNISKTDSSFTIDDNATLNKYKNQFTTLINVASNETLIFPEDSELINNIPITNGGIIENKGTLISENIIKNEGTIKNNKTGILEINMELIQENELINDGKIRGTGNIDFKSFAAYKTTTNTINISGVAPNYEIKNYTLNDYNGLKTTLDITSVETIDVEGTFVNKIIINNYGTIHDNECIINDGTIENNGLIHIARSLNSGINSKLDNNGIINNNSIIINNFNGTINNNNYLNIKENGTITINGTMNQKGVLTRVVNGHTLQPYGNLTNVNIENTNVEYVSLIGANMTGANLTNVDFTNAELSYANLKNTILEGTNLENTDLKMVRSGNISGNPILSDYPVAYNIIEGYLIGKEVDLREEDLTGKNFTNVNMEGSKLTNATMKNANMEGTDLTKVDFTNANMEGINLTNADLTNVDLTNENMKNANLTGANLTGANMTGANLTGANMLNTILQDVCFNMVDLQEANLKNADLKNADLKNAILGGADMKGANLDCADLTKTILIGVQLQNASMIKTNLTEASLAGINLRGADLRGANMTRACLNNADLRPGDTLTNTPTNLTGSILIDADLEGAKMTNIFLNDANLQGANLTNVKLNYAYMKRVNLTNADLQGANLTGADLTEADLTNVKNAILLKDSCLTRANLTNADLQGADLTNADLQGANVTNADLQCAILIGANLTDVIGWDTAKTLCCIVK